MSKLSCKSCEAPLEHSVYDFGMMPAVNSFITEEQIESEEKYPLTLYVCESCWLLQLGFIPPPSLLFEDYHHISGASKGNVDHLRSVSQVIDQNLRKTDSKILEIGCNDGTLLGFLDDFGYSAVGCDPAKNISQKEELKVYTDFFGEISAERIKSECGGFDVVVGLNVFAHNSAFIDMLKGCVILLNPDGKVMIEVAYAPSTICDGNFDTIYHEHVCSYSLTSLKNALSQAGLSIFDAELIPTQGGSIRIFAQHVVGSLEPSENFLSIMNMEERLGLSTSAYYEILGEKIKNKIGPIRELLSEVVRDNQQLLILGAPARGVVVMNVCGVEVSNHSIIIDDTEEKQGKLMPGVHIPVSDWSGVDFSKFESALILSWNYAENMKERLSKTKFSGPIYIPFPDFTKT
jgi:SAM-dependent methyltransferase